MSNYRYEPVLIHHGVKGQKWGIRRFQKEDGSLTPAGVKRYSDMENNSLQHHGVKGMKWGVRRYENKGGSYTLAGVKHFRGFEKDYDEADSAYKKAKQNYKDGTPGSSKGRVQEAKVARKVAKQNLNRAYDQVKRDYKADKGKNRYQMGQTITGRGANVARILSGAGLVAAGTKYAYDNGKISTKTMKQVLTGTAVVTGAAMVKQAVNSIGDSQLRAYYAHSRPKNVQHK